MSCDEDDSKRNFSGGRRVPTFSESQIRVLGIGSSIILSFSFEEQGATSETETTRLLSVRRGGPFLSRNVQEVSNSQGPMPDFRSPIALPGFLGVVRSSLPASRSGRLPPTCNTRNEELVHWTRVRNTLQPL